MDVKELHSGVEILYLQPAEHFISTYIVPIILCPFKLVKWDVLVLLFGGVFFIFPQTRQLGERVVTKKLVKSLMTRGPILLGLN